MDLYEKMVSINSFTGNRDGVNRLGAYTASLFAGYGFTLEKIQSVNPAWGAHHILSRPGGSFRAGLVSHLDTVFPEDDEIKNNFRWRVDGRRVYGPGTNDIKGGTVIIFMMIDAVSKLFPEQFASASWDILLDATEETESDDFGALCADRLGGNNSACLIFEAGDISEDTFSIVTSRKGRAVFSVYAEGKGAHAGSNHAEGVNAITQIADAAKILSGITDYSRDLTCNVGEISGGGYVNRVPHEASLRGEARAFASEALDSAVEKILALKDYSSVQSSDGKNIQAALRPVIERMNPAWPQNAGSQKLFGIWKEAADSIGYIVQPEARGGLSDGNFIWGACPSIDGLGPSGGNSHCSERSDDLSKDQEYADLDSFIPRTVLNTTALLRLIRGR
jgi:glutamate carboxypeptidase